MHYFCSFSTNKLFGFSLKQKNELEGIQKKQTEIKNVIIEIKNTFKGINSRLHDTEELLSKLEDRVWEITEPEQKMEKK